MSQRSVLVLGATGFTGRVLLEELRARGHRLSAPGRQVLDLRDPGAVRRHVAAAAPDAVVNVAAAQPGASAEELRAVNVTAAGALATAAAACRARLVHVASDAAHDGRRSPYDDDAPFRPITPYGRSKADGEHAVLRACPGAVSVRTSLLWDPGEMDRGTAAFAGRLARGEPCTGFVDEIRCPLPRRVLAACLADLLDVLHAGPLNIAGREALSRHELACLLLRHFGVPDVERVEPVRAADLEAAGAPPRPRDLRLTVTRAERLLRRRLPGVRELL